MDSSDFDMTTFAGRLAFAMKQAGKVQADIAEELKVSQQAVSLWLKGEGGKKYSAMLAKLLGIRAEWLAEGDGGMKEEFSLTDKEKALILAYRKRSDSSRAAFEAWVFEEKS